MSCAIPLLAPSRFLRRRVSLTQAFCHCYYQMAVQQVTVRCKNQPHLQASGWSEPSHAGFECGWFTPACTRPRRL